MLKDKLISVTPNNGSHFTMLKMVEGFLEPQHVKTINAGSMPKRMEALRRGEVAAVVLMEPWISVAQKEGLRILIESHSTRSEAASDDVDGVTLAAMFRAQARAVADIEQDPTPYVNYLIAETGGRLEAKDFQTWRLLHAPAAAVHARAVRRYVQLDRQMEHDRAGGDVREHGRQQSVDVTTKITKARARTQCRAQA